MKSRRSMRVEGSVGTIKRTVLLELCVDAKTFLIDSYSAVAPLLNQDITRFGRQTDQLGRIHLHVDELQVARLPVPSSKVTPKRNKQDYALPRVPNTADYA